MFCKIFKLITGDIVIGVTEEEEINHAAITTTIFDPIKVEVIRLQTSSSFMDTVIIKPLLPMTLQDYIIVRNEHIVYDAFVGESYVKQYTEFIESKNAAKEQPPSDDTSIFSNTTNSDDIPPENHLDLTDPEEEEFFDEQPAKRTYH